MALRQRSGTLKPTFAEHARRAAQPEEEDTNGGGVAEDVYCEMCESKNHDTLDCTHLTGGAAGASPSKTANGSPQQQDFTPGKENRSTEHETTEKSDPAPVGADEDKWCALCEEDGHLAFDCPKEQY